MEDEGIGDILRLPVECVARAIALTSPRDACLSEFVSVAFRVAAASDAVWERFLPNDYLEIISRAVEPLNFAEKKHLYFRLCDSILIDGGRMSFVLDKETGAKCFILAARELIIVWGDNPEYWQWKHHPESRFYEVAELMNVCWLEIRGKIGSRILTEKTNYTAYLIFKLPYFGSIGLSYPSQVSVKIGAHVFSLSVCLLGKDEEDTGYLHWRYFRNGFLYDINQQSEPEDIEHDLEVVDDVEELQNDQQQDQDEQDQDEHEDDGEEELEEMVYAKTRQDGWKEVLIGEFYSGDGDDAEVELSLMETKGGHWKSGLIVQGIEIRVKNTF